MLEQTDWTLRHQSCCSDFLGASWIICRFAHFNRNSGYLFFYYWCTELTNSRNDSFYCLTSDFQKCLSASFNTSRQILRLLQSFTTNFTSIKKMKEICFLLEVNRFTASFRLVDHIGENHASAQFQISPMLCIPKFFFLGAGINFNTIFSYFGRFPN